MDMILELCLLQERQRGTVHCAGMESGDPRRMLSQQWG